MLKAIAEIVYVALAGALASVTVWHEERAQEAGSEYVTFSVDTSLQGEGTAPIHELTIEVYCYAPTSAAATSLAESAKTALDGLTEIRNGVRVAGVQSAGSQREYDSDTGQWIVSLRFTGLVIS